MNLTEQKYRQDHRVNASLLKLYSSDLDPRIAKYKALNPFKPTEAMTLGSLLHDLMENDGAMSFKFIVSEYKDFKTVKSRKWRDEVTQSGRTIVKPEVLEQAHEMRESICTYAPMWMFEDEVQNEVPFYSDTEKCLCDRIHPSRKAIIDWKSSSCTSAAQFARECVKYGYFMAGAHYLDVSEYDEFWLVAVSTVEPYPVWTFKLTEEALAFGRDLKQRAYINMESPIDNSTIDLHAPSWWDGASEETAEEAFDL